MADLDADLNSRRRLPDILEQPIWVYAVIGGIALLVVGALVAVLLSRNTREIDAS